MMLTLAINKGLAKVLFWIEISRQRKQLREMRDCDLKDIGISRTDADREAKRLFWDYAPVAEPSSRSRTGTISSVLIKEENPEVEFKIYRSSP